MSVIRRVRNSDKDYVLRYCTETFEWGDYIHDVWDDWLYDGVFLACDFSDKIDVQNPGSDKISNPVGICHVSVSQGQVWIEGIRIHPKYRRRGVATLLVKTAENMVMGKCSGVDIGAVAMDAVAPDVADETDMNAGCESDADCHATIAPTTITTTTDTAVPSRLAINDTYASCMLIETKNHKSLEMAQRLGYSITNTWTYYKATPQLSKSITCNVPSSLGETATFSSSSSQSLPFTTQDADNFDHAHKHPRHKSGCHKCTVDIYTPCQDLDPRVHSHCVKSWRWYETDPAMLQQLASGGMIAAAQLRHIKYDQNNKKVPTVSIACVSKSVGGPGMTLYATIYPGPDEKCIHAMIRHLEDTAARNSCASLNLFTRCDLPTTGRLTNRHDFYLVKKHL